MLVGCSWIQLPSKCRRMQLKKFILLPDTQHQIRSAPASCISTTQKSPVTQTGTLFTTLDAIPPPDVNLCANLRCGASRNRSNERSARSDFMRVGEEEERETEGGRVGGWVPVAAAACSG